MQAVLRAPVVHGWVIDKEDCSRIELKIYGFSPDSGMPLSKDDPEGICRQAQKVGVDTVLLLTEQDTTPVFDTLQCRTVLDR